MNAYGPFTTEPDLILDDGQLRKLQSALDAFDRKLPLDVSPIIAGRPSDSARTFESHDPSRRDRIVSVAGSADESHAEGAIDTLGRAQDEWAGTSQKHRSDIIRRAAEGLRRRRTEALCLLVRECGKTWREADAEFCEAVDFLELYARAAIDETTRVELVQYPGETNVLRYQARGIAAAIIPWNFPIAIGLGMTVGPLVMGNAVIIKPAEQTPSTGTFIHSVLVEAGVPANVLAMLPGAGDVGANLVDHPGVDTILFTGSRDVGLQIIQKAGTTLPSQQQVTKVVAEMGGKNCIIVDESADLDRAILPILMSGMAFGGQKCSAASRIIAHESIVDDLCERLGRAVSGLSVGDGADATTDVTALIDPDAQVRVERIIQEALATGGLVGQATLRASNGNFVAPTVVRDLPAGSPLLIEEAFGPFMTVESYVSLDDAVSRVNALPYALTGGIFSTTAEHIEQVAQQSPVGNFYVNRKVTGAYVGRQPFGGNRMSGIGVKAGSAEYVLQFVHQRVICSAAASDE